MTEHLVATGAPVTAIEIDASLVRRLNHLRQQFPNLQVIASDILKVDIAEVAAGRRVRIYGNLPYYITSPILHHLFEFASIIDEIHIVIQREVAERIAAGPGGREYGYLSVATQLYSRPELVLEIPREAFDPPPEVASALVTLRLPGHAAALGNIDKEQLLDFVKTCFAQKRKTLVNNLRSLGKSDEVRAALDRCGLRPDARAEQLNLLEFAALARELRTVAGG
jgi:16S rRNA (adenine1518-N6/adenine1519-N6)-dimethyltransferase